MIIMETKQGDFRSSIPHKYIHNESVQHGWRFINESIRGGC